MYFGLSRLRHPVECDGRRAAGGDRPQLGADAAGRVKQSLLAVYYQVSSNPIPGGASDLRLAPPGRAGEGRG